MKESFFIALVCILFLGGSPFDKVKFTVPPKWHMLNETNSDTVSACLYLVQKVITKTDTLYANAVVQCYPVPDSVDIDKADNVVSAHSHGMDYILSAKDGKIWKTYFLDGVEQGIQYIMLYRIGIYKGSSFEFCIGFPNAGSSRDTKPLKVLTLPSELVVDDNMSGIYCVERDVEKFMGEFNAVCNSMEIEGQTNFHARAILVDPPKNGKNLHDDRIKK